MALERNTVELSRKKGVVEQGKKHIDDPMYEKPRIYVFKARGNQLVD
jgi:hypothetical protein